MNLSQLRLSNYNYDAPALLGRIRQLFERDAGLLGDGIIRSALVRGPASEIQHVLTRIDVLPKGVTADCPELLDYGTILFVREPVTRDVLLERLEMLSAKQFQIAQYNLASNALGFRDTYEHSCNSYSDWPCTVFHISFGSTQFSDEPLLHPNLKSFSSTSDAIREFLKFGAFNGQSDGRLGGILLAIPNLNARIQDLSLSRQRLDVKASGAAPPTSLKICVSYRGTEKSDVLEKALETNSATFQLKCTPREIDIWLLSRTGFLADFHTENEHYTQGVKAILPKAPAVEPLDAALIDLAAIPSLGPSLTHSARPSIARLDSSPARFNWRDFEKHAKAFFQKELNVEFLEHMPLPLSSGGHHKFDLTSPDETIVIECKSHTWTKSGRYPSAKVSDVQRSIELLHKCTAKRKIIVFQDDFHDSASLVEVFVRRNRALLAGIEVWRLANGKFSKFVDYSQRSPVPVAPGTRLLDIVFHEGTKPYFEEQPKVVTGRVLTDRRYRVGVHNTGTATLHKVRVVLESCEPGDSPAVHPGHTLQVMGEGTGEFSVHPGDVPSVFVDVIYDEIRDGQPHGDAFGLCYSAPVSYAIPRGSYVLTLRLDGGDTQIRKKFAVDPDPPSGILRMRELRS